MKGPKKKAVERFRGLALGDDDRRALAAKKAGGRLSAQHWRRIRILELLDQKWTMQEYVRLGTANAFCIVAPKTGRQLTHATANRKARRFAGAIKRISDAYPKARRIHLILDNLNTHRLKSLTDAYGDTEGRRLWRRFVIHHTPKHGSWLNPAEVEVSLWSRECAGHDRIATLCELQYRTRLWNKAADRARRKINWRFTTADARRVFRYRAGTTPGPKD